MGDREHVNQLTKRYTLEPDHEKLKTRETAQQVSAQEVSMRT